MSDNVPTINKDVNYVYEKPKPINLFSSINEEVRRNAEAADLEETIKRIQGHKGVVGMMIVNNDGVAVRTTMDATQTNQHCAVLSRLSDQARSAVRDLDPTNDITFLRLRSKKNEILLAPDRDFILVVIQSPSDQ